MTVSKIVSRILPVDLCVVCAKFCGASAFPIIRATVSFSDRDVQPAKRPAFPARLPFLRRGPLNVRARLYQSEKRHRYFHLGQMCARAGMHARAERKMPCRCPVDVEFVRPFGGRRVAVAGNATLDMLANGMEGNSNYYQI